MTGTDSLPGPPAVEAGMPPAGDTGEDIAAAISLVERVVPPGVRDVAVSPLVVLDSIRRAALSSGFGANVPVGIASVLVGLFIPIDGRPRRWIPFSGDAAR